MTAEDMTPSMAAQRLRAAILERLPKSLERVTTELSELVKEQHAVVGKGAGIYIVLALSSLDQGVDGVGGSSRHPPHGVPLVPMLVSTEAELR
jgi:hypothetical protein